MKTINWALIPTKSQITFKVKHLMISFVKGEFKIFEASIAGEDFTKSTISANIKVKSIFTGISERDSSILGKDFFDVEKYPEILFVSSSMKKVRDKKYQLIGQLTIKETTKEIKFDTIFGGFGKDSNGNEIATFTISGKLNRKDYGLNWNAALEVGGVMVGNEIKINADVFLNKRIS